MLDFKVVLLEVCMPTGYMRLLRFVEPLPVLEVGMVSEYGEQLFSPT